MLFQSIRKGINRSKKNYQPDSLLLICGNIFERLINNNLFKYFIENDIISQNQSGLKSWDSCINQLISITHEICQSFDDRHEDIFKAFDKV